MSARRVLVTGASRGIGAALVERFLAAGDQVFGCGRAAADGTATDRYTHYTADVADEQAVREMFGDIRRRAGGLDVLVNNAGIARMNLLPLTPPADARQIVETNVLGVFNCMHQAVRLMRRSAAGRIVNLTTVAVPLRLEGEAIYAASKAAVESLTRVTAREARPDGHHVQCRRSDADPHRPHRQGPGRRSSRRWWPGRRFPTGRRSTTCTTSSSSSCGPRAG